MTTTFIIMLCLTLWLGKYVLIVIGIVLFFILLFWIFKRKQPNTTVNKAIELNENIQSKTELNTIRYQNPLKYDQPIKVLNYVSLSKLDYWENYFYENLDDEMMDNYIFNNGDRISRYIRDDFFAQVYKDGNEYIVMVSPSLTGQYEFLGVLKRSEWLDKEFACDPKLTVSVTGGEYAEMINGEWETDYDDYQWWLNIHRRINGKQGGC